jgi:hypothetical protein
MPGPQKQPFSVSQIETQRKYTDRLLSKYDLSKIHELSPDEIEEFKKDSVCVVYVSADNKYLICPK